MRNESRTETTMVVSNVSLKTMKKTGTAKTCGMLENVDFSQVSSQAGAVLANSLSVKRAMPLPRPLCGNAASEGVGGRREEIDQIRYPGEGNSVNVVGGLGPAETAK